jgi:sugar lactone lactonase YvrE
MTDNNPEPTPSDAAGPVYTEQVIEYVDNRRQRAVLIALLILLFLLLLGVAYWVFALTRPAGQPTKSQLPSGMTWVRSIYGWGNKPDQALASPSDVAMGPDGTIWTISGHHEIIGFNPDGSAKRVIYPKVGVSLEGIAVAENGDLFIADFGGMVYQFKPDGTLVSSWKVQLPNEVDVRGGKIAVAAANGVAVFTADDKILAQWGSRGSGNDQFDLPHGILLGPDGAIYVSDTHNRRVRAFSSAGRMTWSAGTGPRAASQDWRSPDASSSLFELPSGLTMDGAGRLVVVDPFKFQVIVLDAKTGKQARENGDTGKLAVYGDYGLEDGLFAYPTGIAYDKTRDWFAVADTGNNRIQIIRIPGSGGSRLAPLIGGFRWPMCIFCLPLILLLIAAIVAATRRRRERLLEETAPEAPVVVSAQD